MTPDLKTADFIIQGYRSGAPVPLLAQKFKLSETEIAKVILSALRAQRSEP